MSKETTISEKDFRELCVTLLEMGQKSGYRPEEYVAILHGAVLSLAHETGVTLRSIEKFHLS